MKSILYLHDASAQAENAFDYALQTAIDYDAHLVVKQLTDTDRLPEKELVFAGRASNNLAKNHAVQEYKPHDLNYPNVTFLKDDVIEKPLQEIIKDYNAGLVIMNYSGNLKSMEAATYGILSKINCPLLLVPGHQKITKTANAVLLTDLRYCATDAVLHLNTWAKQTGKHVTIAHIATSGMPDVVEPYGSTLYDQVVKNCKKDNFTYNHITERNVNKVADVLIHVMKADMLAMAYRRYHFKTLTEGNNRHDGLAQLPVPLLLFPC